MRLVRAGQSYRLVARTMRVSLSTVAYWVRRAGEERLDRVDWSDQSHRPKRLARQHPLTMIQAVLRTRRWLRRFDALGDYGPAAIRDHLLAQGQPVPCERTIARWVTQAEPEVVKRRWPRPPRGWYLPSVANASSELDRVDVVEGLRLARRGRVEVLNCLSLWESLPGSHPAVRITTTETLHWLGLHWRKHGRPHYVQFDNDTIFSGAHARRDYLGRLVHWCLCLGVTPVFAPPLEKGFQAGIEAYNRRWQERVWQRWRHPSLSKLRERSAAFIDAYIGRRRRGTGMRRAWQEPARVPVSNQIILLRRLDESGRLRLCSQHFQIARSWAQRLVRCEIDVNAQMVRCYRLSHRDPHYQTHIAKRKIKLRLVPWWKTPR